MGRVFYFLFFIFFEAKVIITTDVYFLELEIDEILVSL